MKHIKEIMPAIKQNGSKQVSTRSSEPRYNCPICKDGYWVHQRLANGEVDYSKVIRCKCRDEIDKKEKQQLLLRWCNLPAKTEHKLLCEFQTYGEKLLKEALDISIKVSKGDDNVRFFTIIAESDRGKSHLAIGICREWLNKNRVAIYVNVDTLLNELRDGYEREGELSFYSRLKRYQNVGLLCLDDFGTNKISEWGAGQLQSIINSRYDEALHTVVTTNRPLDDLFNFQDYPKESWRDLANMRLASRLQRESWCQVIVLDTIAHIEREEREHLPQIKPKDMKDWWEDSSYTHRILPKQLVEPRILPGTICWKQNKPKSVYGILPPPYRQEDFFAMREIPPGYVEEGYEGEGSAFKSLQVIGGIPVADVEGIDLGWTKFNIRRVGEKQVEIEYVGKGETNNEVSFRL